MGRAVSPAAAEVGRRVRSERAARGFTQESFAAACAIDRSYMGHIERGERNVTLHTLLTLAETLELDASELIAGLVAP